MSNSPRYKWQKNWNLDYEAGIATHESGVQYRQGTSGIVFMVSDKYANEYGEKVASEMGILKATEHLQRMKREAVKLLTNTPKDKNGKPITSHPAQR